MSAIVTIQLMRKMDRDPNADPASFAIFLANSQLIIITCIYAALIYNDTHIENVVPNAIAITLSIYVITVSYFIMMLRYDKVAALLWSAAGAFLCLLTHRIIIYQSNIDLFSLICYIFEIIIILLLSMGKIMEKIEMDKLDNHGAVV